jgi:hypothetical protein
MSVRRGTVPFSSLDNFHLFRDFQDNNLATPGSGGQVRTRRDRRRRGTVALMGFEHYYPFRDLWRITVPRLVRITQTVKGVARLH